MNIDVKELKERLANGGAVNILDVREEWEYEEVNIGAKNIPLGDLPTRLTEIESWKSEEIVVHCKSGGRSAQAQKYLKGKGYSNVRNLTGGIEAYIA